MNLAQWYTTVISVLAMAGLILIIWLSIQRRRQERKDKKQDEFNKLHDPSKINYSRPN